MRTLTDIRTHELLQPLHIPLKQSQYCLSISTAVNLCIFPLILIPTVCSHSLDPPTIFWPRIIFSSCRCSQLPISLSSGPVNDTSAAVAVCGSFPQFCAASITANKLQLQLLSVDHFHSSALQALLQINFSCSCCLWIISTVLRCKQYCKQTSAAVAVCGSFPQICVASSTATKLKLQLLSVDHFHSSTLQAVLQKSSAAVAVCGSFPQFCAASSTAKNLQLQLLSVDHFYSSAL